MALAVIGVGFGRTGTESMKLALELLSLGPCHHMSEVIGNPRQTALWRAASKGIPTDWDEVFAGYRSAMDWPAAFFWRELSRHYPEAKIILTVRDPDSWYESMAATVLAVIKASTDQDSVGVKLIGERVFDNRIDERSHVIAVYKSNNAEVQRAFGPQRLLVYPLGAGWEPLCRFLGKPVPDVPYPRSNSAAEFRSRILPSEAK